MSFRKHPVATKGLMVLLALVVMLSPLLDVRPQIAHADEPPAPTVYLFRQSTLDPGTPDWHLIGAPYGEITPGVDLYDTLISISAWQDGQARSFAFNVPATGSYVVKMQGQLMDLGGIGEISVDGQTIGIFDFYDPVTMADQFESEARALSVMHLEAGMHELTFKAIGHTAGSTRRNMHPTKFILNPLSGAVGIQEVAIKGNASGLQVGATSQLGVEAVLTDQTRAALQGAQTIYASADTGVATVDAQTGLLTAVGAGQTAITATVVYEGTTYTASLPVTVQPPQLSSVTYLFRQSTLDPGTPEWHLIGAPYGEITPGVDLYDTLISISAFENGHARSFAFNVPATGNYVVKMQGQLMDLGGIGEISVDGQVVGIFDFYDPVTMADQFESEARALSVMNLEAGMHELTFKAIGHTAGSARRNMHPTKFILDSLTSSVGIEEAAIKWNAPALYVGMTAQLGVQAVLTGGTRAGLPGAQTTYASADAGVATVHAQTGLLSAVGVGQTTITATVVYEGTTYTASLPITVQQPQPVKQTFLFNRFTLNPGTPEWHLIGEAYGQTPGVDMYDTLISISAYADGHARSFGFHVNADGLYKVQLQGQLMDIGGIGEISVDGQVIGIFDFYDPVSMAEQFESEVRTLAAMELQAGMHELKFKAIGHTAGSWRRNMHPTKFIIDPASGGLEIGSASIKWDSPVLYIGSRTKLSTETFLTDGSKALFPGLQVSYQSANGNVATVNAQSGLLEATGIGQTTITATVQYGGKTVTANLNVEVIELVNAKTRSTLYTPAKIQNARDNIANYDWAQSMKDAAVAKADIYLAQGLDFLWKLVPPQSLPRSATVNLELGSPITGREVDKYGNYPYLLDPINDPWKITDPSSGYRFPTNDFKSYYESGLNEHGIFERELADPAFLVNTLYPEKGPTWGVDDGRGWIDENGNYYTFIAYYVHWLWGAWEGTGEIRKALGSLRDAYLYTGDVKYARAGTVLLDRIADVYPSLDISVYGMEHYLNSHGFTGLGKALGMMWEPFLVKDLLRAYDAFYPAMDDPQLIGFLQAKAQEYDLGPLKSSATGIRKNIETGIVEQVYPGSKSAQMNSNNGVHQSALAMAAVVYDKLPETKEWMDFNFKSGGLVGLPYAVTGGNMGVTFVNEVDHDGAGNEASAAYNLLWLSSYLEAADILDGYDGYSGADLYDHVKFRKMFSAIYPLTLGQRYTAGIGDASKAGNPWLLIDQAQMLKAFQKYGDPIFAQLAYFMNNNSTAGMHSDIFTQNAEQIAGDVQAAIDEHGLLKLDSINMTGYGFAALRDGENPADITGTRYPFQKLPIVSMTADRSASIKSGALEFAGAAVGDSIAFSFDVAQTDNYELLLKPQRSIWYGGSGIYDVKLDGQTIGEIDFYGTRQDRETFGIRQLSAGTHVVEFVSTGKNPLSNNFKMALFELAILDGQQRQERSATLGPNTLRDLWLYYGRNYAHGHSDNLNLGLIAFGLDLSPDLGYPESTSNTDTHNHEWMRNTISHNTVVVDRTKQSEQWVGQPKQFDDRSIVKLIDVEGPEVYPQTELYKRTSAMIRVDRDNSYVVDFFRVKGGSEHHFSFHGAEGDVTVEGLTMTPQLTGTYEGPNVEYGQRPSDDYGTGSEYTGSGFHYLKNVERDEAPSSPFSVDWAVEDTWEVLSQSEDIHLRLTMLNENDEVALADGVPSRTEIGNPESLKYMIAKRTGTNLQSTFTSVIEPYKDARFVSSIENVAVKAGGAVASDMDVRAVKVTLANGRVDYIVSALDPETTYTIDDKLQFKGSFGVYSEMNGQRVYSYVNDGTVLGLAGTPEIDEDFGHLSGTVADFTKSLQVNNEIIVNMNLQGHPASDLVNRMIYVENDGLRNAVYTIKAVTDLGNGQYSLDIGDTTLIRSYQDDDDFDAGFIYDLAEGAAFRIPLSFENEAPAGIAASLNKAKLTVGETGQIAVTGKRLDGSAADLTGAAFTFTSDRTDLASVSANGVVTAHGAGEATITVQAAWQGLSFSTELAVTIEAASPAIELQSIRLDGAPVTMNVGETVQVSATAVYSDGSERGVTAGVQFASSKPEGASISPAGKVTALRPGAVRITASLDGKTATVKVNVRPHAPGNSRM